MLEACKTLVESPITIPRSPAEIIAAFKSYMRNRTCGIVFNGPPGG
jgi:hypothetical protein